MKELPEVKPSEITGVLERLFLSNTKTAESVVVEGEHLILSREACPEILLLANKQKPEIILVQKFTEHIRRLMSVDDPGMLNNKSHSKVIRTPTKEKSSGDDLDVTGSPLRCPFMVDDDTSDFSPFTVSLAPGKKKLKGELSYTPISCNKFGLVASRVNLALCKISVEKDDCTPLWVVCDGKDPQGTFFIGLHRVGDLVSRTLVTSAGPYVGCEELPSLDHLKIHHTSTFPTKMVESTVTATYDILSGEDSERSSIRLTCAWKRPLTLLTPPAPNASTEANVVIVPSDQRSAAHQMHQELSVLRGFVAGLSTGEVAWFVREGDKTVAEQIEDVFASVREKGQRQKKDEEASADCDKKVEEKFFSRRQNMDFIDLLWMVLMKCESYQELKESLEFIFKAVVMGQVRPQIHVRNNTQVGNLVRSLMRGQADLPELTGLMPLNMLIEMGIEKIKKDYINIFQAGDLATGEQLSWFVGYTDCMEDSVMQLEKLHVALQVVVLLHTYLNLPSSALVQFTAQALNQLKEGLSSPYSFSFKLSTFTVHQLLNSLKPSMWELVLHSTHSTLEKTLVCHVSHRPLIQMPNAHNDLEESAADCDKEEPEGFEERHFCTFITTVTDKILT